MCVYVTKRERAEGAMRIDGEEVAGGKISEQRWVATARCLLAVWSSRSCGITVLDESGNSTHRHTPTHHIARRSGRA